MELPIPANAIEFDKLYHDEESCIRALIMAKWPDGFVCPQCECDHGWELETRPVVECVGCGHQASATAGTLFHGAKLALLVLFRMAYLLVAEKSGTNMCALMRQCGVSYPTAVLWARKIRRAMVRPQRERLAGTVEVDETTLGGPAPGHPGRQLGPNQALVLVMVEDAGGNSCGRARLEVVESAGADDLGAAVRENVETGSTVRTDGWASYGGLVPDYKSVVRTLRGGADASEELPLVHRVASLLKSFVDGVLHGRWTKTWLPDLLEEFTFRFNRRRSRCRPLLFNRVLQHGVVKRAPTRRLFQAYAIAMGGT
jgi:Zn ribbon nucleic-acid-binding protein